jgi:hypothetical protein
MRMAGLQGLSQAEVGLRVLKLGVRLKGLASAVNDAIKVAFAQTPSRPASTRFGPGAAHAAAFPVAPE